MEEPIPLFQIDEHGRSHVFGTICPIEPSVFVVALSTETAIKTMRDLPFFLQALRPSGFLGRLVPKHHPAQGYPSDITLWKPEHCLHYWSHFAWNLPGNIIVGERALETYLKQTEGSQAMFCVARKERSERYAQIATDLLQAGNPGSSAAGEQPKFLACVDNTRHVLVKFSPDNDSPVAKRVADLLVSEHIALGVLRENKVSAALSELVATKTQVFLEVERFDRVATHGRRAVLPLSVLDAEFAGTGDGWIAASKRLFSRQLISKQDLESVVLLELFSILIGNTNRHLGNISFFASKDFHSFSLAPAYDQLPMFYHPVANTLVDREFSPDFPLAPQSLWMKAYIMARQFWTTVVEDKRVSSEFKTIAKCCLKVVSQMDRQIGRLPD